MKFNYFSILPFYHFTILPFYHFLFVFQLKSLLIRKLTQQWTAAKKRHLVASLLTIRFWNFVYSLFQAWLSFFNHLQFCVEPNCDRFYTISNQLKLKILEKKFKQELRFPIFKLMDCVEYNWQSFKSNVTKENSQTELQITTEEP